MIAAGSPVERWGGDAGRGRGRGPPGPTPPRWGAPGPERHQHPDRWGGPIAPETRPREARDKWEKWGGFEGKPLGANSYCGSAIAGFMLVAQVAWGHVCLGCALSLAHCECVLLPQCGCVLQASGMLLQGFQRSRTCLMMTNGALHMVSPTLSSTVSNQLTDLQSALALALM